MGSEEGIILGVMLAYFAFMLFLGYGLKERIKAVDDYILGGRGFPWFVLTMTMLATLANAQQTLGIAGLTYLSGVSFLFWFFVVVNVFIYPILIRFGTRLRSLSLSTVVDLAERRFPGSGRLTVVLSLWQVAWGVMSVAICLFGGALLIDAVFGISWQYALFLVLAVTLLYTLMGGLRAVVITDVIQWVIIITGTAIFIPLMFAKYGAFSGFFARVLGPTGFGAPTVEGLWRGFSDIFTLPPGPTGSWLVVLAMGLAGSLWIPIDLGFVQRMLAAKDPLHGRKAALSFLVVVTLWATLMLGLGAMARVLFPGIQNTDTVIIVLARDAMPVLGAALFVTAVAAAVMSTVDTYLNAGAAILTRNIYQRFFRPHASEGHYLVVARVFTIVMAVLALAVAPFVSISGVFVTALAIQMIICASLAPLMLLATFWKRMTERAAFWGNLVTATIMLYLVYRVGGPGAAFAGAGLGGIPVIFIGLAIAFPLYVLFSLAEPYDPARIGPDFRDVFEGRIQLTRVGYSDLIVIGAGVAVAVGAILYKTFLAPAKSAVPPLSGPTWITDGYFYLVSVLVIGAGIYTLIRSIQWIKSENIFTFRTDNSSLPQSPPK